MNLKYIIGAVLGVVTLAYLFSVCSPAGKNKTGHEYMPDMAHPVTYETNVYSAYEYNHWDAQSAFTKAQLSQPHGKVEGTVARGATGVYYAGAGIEDVLRGKNAPNAISTPINGEAPFPYMNDIKEPYLNERIRCEQELVANPYPITDAGLAAAKPLYNTYCGICHGEKGDGQGWIYSKPDSKYPAAPKNLIGDDMIAAGNGRYYYAIMHGKNVMGGYSDKLSFEERWQVIHYIRALQAKAKNLEYGETANTLSNIEKPAKGEPTGAPRVFVAPAAQ
jgi:mono/diheme cytochrome c family protein